MQLISQEEVIGLAFTPDDVINPANIRLARIEIAQLRYIRPAFGNQMYRNMILQKYDSFVADYIKPALAHFIRYELIGEFAVRASDLGVVKPSAEQTQLEASSTKNDTQNRTDSAREEQNKLEVAENTTTKNLLQNTTKQTTDKNTSEKSSIKQENDQETVNVTESDKTTSQKTTSEQTDTSISVTMTEDSGVDQNNLNKETLTQTIISGETATQNSSTDTSDLSQEVKTTDNISLNTNQEQNNLSTKNLSVEATSLSENTSQSSSSKTAKNPASAAEWQLLARQALRDAKTFLRYAVEYVEENKNLFPDYAPTSGLGANTFKRCIGGVIL